MLVPDPISRPSRIQPQNAFFRVRDIARRWGVGVNQVVAQIHNGLLRAVDMRKPGASRPLYRVPEQALADFERSRAVTPPPAPVRGRRSVAIPNHVQGE